MTNLFGGAVAAGAALLLAVIAIFVAFVMPGDDELAPPRSAVTAECVGTDCMSVEEIEAMVGFIPLEPRELPAGYVLYARHVLQDEIPPEARERIAQARGVPLSEVPTLAPPTTVHIEIRFRSRPFVPVINVVEIKVDPAAELFLASEGCGEEVQLGDRVLFYGEGAGSVVQEDAGRWSACPASGEENIGNVVFLEGDVLVEVKVLLENLSRSDVLDLVASM